MIYLIFALIGLLVGALINALADDWPRRETLSRPHCHNPECAHVYKPSRWLGISRRLLDGKCPECGIPTRKRVVLVEVTTAVLFAAMPFFFTNPVVLTVYTLYMAILILIIVIDLENRLILDIVTYPGTVLALLFSLILPTINWRSALAGALIGLILFLGVYWLAKVTFGPGAIGQGDVKLAMMMGAMLGVPSIIGAIVLGIIMGGLISGFLLATRLVSRKTYLPYGQYLAIATMIMLIWGSAINAWWLG
ncbi:MAG: prepilin peptidase [Anaerolineae bacterium]|nr:prepilin peptidase [Anaerolineae bacterium]